MRTTMTSQEVVRDNWLVRPHILRSHPFMAVQCRGTAKLAVRRASCHFATIYIVTMYGEVVKKTWVCELRMNN